MNTHGDSRERAAAHIYHWMLMGAGFVDKKSHLAPSVAPRPEDVSATERELLARASAQ